MDEGGFAAARPSIVRKEIGGALAWNREDTCPLNICRDHHGHAGCQVFKHILCTFEREWWYSTMKGEHNLGYWGRSLLILVLNCPQLGVHGTCIQKPCSHLTTHPYKLCPRGGLLVKNEMHSHLRTIDFCIKNECEIEYTLRRHWRLYQLNCLNISPAQRTSLYYSDLRTILDIL